MMLVHYANESKLVARIFEKLRCVESAHALQCTCWIITCRLSTWMFAVLFAPANLPLHCGHAEAFASAFVCRTICYEHKYFVDSFSAQLFECVFGTFKNLWVIC